MWPYGADGQGASLLPVTKHPAFLINIQPFKWKSLLTEAIDGYVDSKTIGSVGDDLI
jgi:hypothetical protein